MKVLITKAYVLQSRVFQRGAVVEPGEETCKALINAKVAKLIEEPNTATRKGSPEKATRNRKKR